MLQQSDSKDQEAVSLDFADEEVKRNLEEEAAELGNEAPEAQDEQQSINLTDHSVALGQDPPIGEDQVLPKGEDPKDIKLVKSAFPKIEIGEGSYGKTEAFFVIRQTTAQGV